jgi:hypothetical protein
MVFRHCFNPFTATGEAGMAKAEAASLDTPASRSPRAAVSEAIEASSPKITRVNYSPSPNVTDFLPKSGLLVLMAEQQQVFLSHEGAESEAANALAQSLRNCGISVWIDSDYLLPGKRWMAELEDALGRVACFVVYVGRNGAARWVDREVRFALAKNTIDPRFRIFPVLGPGADPKALPTFLVTPVDRS